MIVNNQRRFCHTRVLPYEGSGKRLLANVGLPKGRRRPPGDPGLAQVHYAQILCAPTFCAPTFCAPIETELYETPTRTLHFDRRLFGLAS